MKFLMNQINDQQSKYLKSKDTHVDGICVQLN